MNLSRDEILSSEEVHRFVEVVQQFCDVIERLESLPTPFFLERVDELLPLVYSRASGLPSYPWDDRDEDEEGGDNQLEARPTPTRNHAGEWKELYERIAKKLGPHERYSLIFDPFDSQYREIIDGSLADDLASVYLDLKESFELYRSDDEEALRQAIWDWRFGRKIHWGRHAVHAMSAVYSLFHEHYDEDDEVFDI